MSWHAIVPFKARGEGKSRLAEVLSVEEREVLRLSMLAHVAAELQACTRIGRLTLLGPARPEGWPGDWLDDAGLGLNPGLEMARQRIKAERLLVLHADLPQLGADDLSALLDAAEAQGAAVAPDRHGTGTNAIALHGPLPLQFAFGPGSFDRHRTQLPDCSIVRREGLAFDVDTPADLAASVTLGPQETE